MTAPLLLYSTNTWIAYAVAERFYGGIHYAWCSPVYDGVRAAAHVNIPPTASPAEIYRILLEESRRGEQHSTITERNRAGIKRGAEEKRERGIITEAVEEEIYEMIEKSGIADSRPVLFIIPFQKVREIAMEVPVRERAHPFSIEYRIEALPRDCFDMIELRS
ncbi:MAG TPA: hypothetical protein VF746_12390 [Longimicrobium sp.]|jgi:hypothetical protein